MYSRYLKAEKRRVLVCAGTGCVSGGSMEIFERLSELVSKRGNVGFVNGEESLITFGGLNL